MAKSLEPSGHPSGQWVRGQATRESGVREPGVCEGKERKQQGLKNWREEEGLGREDKSSVRNLFPTF